MSPEGLLPAAELEFQARALGPGVHPLLAPGQHLGRGLQGRWDRSQGLRSHLDPTLFQTLPQAEEKTEVDIVEA
jgi:hypothetical protein